MFINVRWFMPPFNQILPFICLKQSLFLFSDATISIVYSLFANKQFILRNYVIHIVLNMTNYTTNNQ